MNYHFRIISNEVEDFIFEILIDSEVYFIDLYHFIQEKLNFDNSQMASFFITDSEWNKEVEITLLDMMGGEGENLVMDKVRLSELVTNKRQRMLYVFDLFAERCLFIELTDINNKRIKTPACLRLEGEPPNPVSENFDMGLDEIIEENEFDETFEEAYNDDYDDNNYKDSDLSFDNDEDFY
jgi:hypothetical protein